MKNRNIDVSISKLKNGFVNIYLGNEEIDVETQIDIRSLNSMFIKCHGKVVYVDFSNEETVVNIFNDQE